MADFFNRINNEINWYLSLEKADFLGVTAFLFCAIILFCFIIWIIAKIIRASQKPPLDIAFKLEDAALESFRKKSFVTCLVRNGNNTCCDHVTVFTNTESLYCMLKM